MKEKCIYCSVPLKKTTVKVRGIYFEALQCPKCKNRVFTEQQADKAIIRLESQRLKKEYSKRPIKIGHSWGMTFPKELTEVFRINNKQSTLKISPDVDKMIIRISVK